MEDDRCLAVRVRVCVRSTLFLERKPVFLLLLLSGGVVGFFSVSNYALAVFLPLLLLVYVWYAPPEVAASYFLS